MSEELENEKWKNVSSVTQWVIATDGYGQRVGRKVLPGREIAVRPSERSEIQHRVAHEKNDIFTNGDMVPVTLVESAPDFAEIQDNDYLSESDLEDVLKGRADALRERVAEIESPTTIKRLLDMCEAKDLASSKVKVLEERYEKLTEYVPRFLGDGTGGEDGISDASTL